MGMLQRATDEADRARAGSEREEADIRRQMAESEGGEVDADPQSEA